MEGANTVHQAKACDHPAEGSEHNKPCPQTAFGKDYLRLLRLRMAGCGGGGGGARRSNTLLAVIRRCAGIGRRAVVRLSLGIAVGSNLIRLRKKSFVFFGCETETGSLSGFPSQSVIAHQPWRSSLGKVRSPKTVRLFCYWQLLLCHMGRSFPRIGGWDFVSVRCSVSWVQVSAVETLLSHGEINVYASDLLLHLCDLLVLNISDDRGDARACF